MQKISLEKSTHTTELMHAFAYGCTDQTEEEDMNSRRTKALLDFSKALAPFFEKLAKESSNKIFSEIK